MLTLSTSLYAQVRMDVTKGANKWGYSAAIGGIVQKWDGSNLTINTTLNLKDADPKKGNLPRECFVGILIQDTRQATRYVAGLLNPGYTRQHAQLPIGLVRHENEGNWKPVAVKGKTLPADQSLQLQVIFKDGKLTLNGSEAGGQLQELLTWDAPEGFKPNLIGLAVDGFKNGFGPVTFESFQVDGKGPAVIDPFDGSVETGTWIQIDDKRLTLQMPGKMEVGLQLDQNDFIFDRGKDINMKLYVQGTRHASLPLSVQVKNDLGQVVHEKSSDVALVQGHTAAFVLPTQAVSRNGVYQLTLRLGMAEEPLYASSSQFAVIEPRKVSAEPDPRSPYVFCWGRDHVPTLARMGMRWQRNSWFMRQLTPVKDGQYNFDKTVADWAQMGKDFGMPPIGPICDVKIEDHTTRSIEDYVDTHVQIIKQARKRFGEQVQLIEIGNEPENWPRAPISNEWITMANAQRMITDRVHKEVPGVRVMSTGTTHVNLGFLSQLAAIGGPDAADIIGVHGYRTPSPPEFGHDQEVAAIQSLFPDKEIWVNEQAYFSLSPDTKFDYDTPVFYPTRMPELKQAIYVARLFMCQFAAGYKGLAYYAWQSDHGLTDSPTHVRPIAPALAAFTWLLPHPTFKRRLTPANTELWALQFESDGQTITGVWSLRYNYYVKLKASEIQNVYDIYGNEMPVKSENGVVTLLVGQAPVYVRGQVSNVLAFEIANDMHVPAYPSLIYRYTPMKVEFLPDVRSMNDSRLCVRLTNRTNARITGKLQVKFNDRILKDAPSNFLRQPIPSAWHVVPENGGAFAIDANGSMDVPCQIVSDDASLPFDPYASREAFVGCWWLTGYLFAARVTMDDQQVVDACTQQGLSLRGIPYQPEIKIDGALADWQNVPLFPQAGLRARNTGHNKFWHGGADYEPTFKIAFNDQGLLFAAIVNDDIQYQPYTGMDMWRCDSVELAIDADVNDDSPVNYHVFLMGQPNKGKAQVVRRRSTSDRAAGVVNDATIQVSRIKPGYDQVGQTIYEVLIPWQQITPYKPNQNRLNFAVQFNEADGWERNGWEGWFIPMGGQLIDSQRMGDLTLIKD
jgi:hypothetical protein